MGNKSILVLCVMSSMLVAEPPLIPLSFDDPYPTSLYKKIVNFAMILWHEMMLVSQASQEESHEVEQTYYMSLGKIACIAIGIELLLSQDHPFYADDIQYFEHILDAIEKFAASMYKHAEQFDAIPVYIARIRTMLANYASSSA
jgi:hypothetical protein